MVKKIQVEPEETPIDEVINTIASKEVKEKSSIWDYVVLAQFLIALIAFIGWKFQYRTIFVYFSFIIFFSYWMIRIIFNPKFKEQISGN
jgi:hypothetical protein